MSENKKFEYDQNSLRTDERRVGLGWLNNNKIKNPLYKEMLHNTNEFWCINAYCCGWDSQFCDDTIEALMAKATEDGLDNILIVKTGIILTFLLERFGNWFKQDYKGEVLCGHILDKGDEYYELHPQCLMIDVAWWNSLTDKSVGEESQTVITTTEPHRSEENLHSGGYTPTWVSKGTEAKTYTGVRFGWNLIKQAIHSDTGVRVWPEEVRKMYEYTYPEIEPVKSFTEGLQMLTGTEGSFYVSNTEDVILDTNFPLGCVKESNECNHVFTTAGGLSNLFEAYNFQGYSQDHAHGGPGSGNRLYVMDASRGGLAMTQHIHNNWTGTEYSKFILNWAEENRFDNMLKGKHTLKNLDDFIDRHPDFTRWFREEFQPKTLPYCYYQPINFFNVDIFKRKIDQFIDRVVAGQRTDEIHRMHFNFSNCFAFLHTAFLYNHDARKQIRGQLLDYLWQKEAEHELLDIDVKYNIWWVRDDLIEIFPWRKND